LVPKTFDRLPDHAQDKRHVCGMKPEACGLVLSVRAAFPLAVFLPANVRMTNN